MFICGVITFLGAVALLSSASPDFIPIPSTPSIGKLPLNDSIATYDVAGTLEELGISVDSVEEILIYVFFTGIGDGTGTASRAFYEIYTQDPQGLKYKQFFNVVFNQPDTVINSANLWIPYTDVGADGNLYAKKINTSGRRSRIMFAAAERQSVEYKNLYEAMNANAQGTVVTDVFLIAYK